MKKLYALYFSPTGSTKQITKTLAKAIQNTLNIEMEEIDYTSFDNRKKEYYFFDEEVVIIGFPTYAGRLPNKVLPDLENVKTNEKSIIVPIVTYGNRGYDDSLKELILLLKNKGFIPISAGAFPTEHAFSDKLANNRPTDKDLDEIENFGRKTAKKIQNNDIKEIKTDDFLIKPYYTPLKEDMTPAKFLKATPKTDRLKCDRCGICAKVCPMNSISKKDYITITNICIKCQACIKVCHNKAKYFDDADFLSHVKMLEKNYAKRKNNLFILE